MEVEEVDPLIAVPQKDEILPGPGEYSTRIGMLDSVPPITISPRYPKQMIEDITPGPGTYEIKSGFEIDSKRITKPKKVGSSTQEQQFPGPADHANQTKFLLNTTPITIGSRIQEKPKEQYNHPLYVFESSVTPKKQPTIYRNYKVLNRSPFKSQEMDAETAHINNSEPYITTEDEYIPIEEESTSSVEEESPNLEEMEIITGKLSIKKEELGNENSSFIENDVYSDGSTEKIVNNNDKMLKDSHKQENDKFSEGANSNTAVRGAPANSAWPLDEPTEIIGDLTDESFEVSIYTTVGDIQTTPSKLVPPPVSPHDVSNVVPFSEDDDNEKIKHTSGHKLEKMISDITRLPDALSLMRNASMEDVLFLVTPKEEDEDERTLLDRGFDKIPQLEVPDAAPVGLSPRASPRGSPFSRTFHNQSQSPRQRREKERPRRSLKEFSVTEDLPDYFAEEEVKTIGRSVIIGPRLPKNYRLYK